jgi:hypothetical protein
MEIDYFFFINASNAICDSVMRLTQKVCIHDYMWVTNTLILTTKYKNYKIPTMKPKTTSLKYPAKRHDLIGDPGWRCWVDKWTNDELKLVTRRFGSKILFYEYFKCGCTKFGCMPNTSIIFPVAAMYIINFIKYCGKINKIYRARLKRKINEKEVQLCKRITVLRSFR